MTIGQWVHQSRLSKHEIVQVGVRVVARAESGIVTKVIKREGRIYSQRVSRSCAYEAGGTEAGGTEASGIEARGIKDAVGVDEPRELVRRLPRRGIHLVFVGRAGRLLLSTSIKMVLSLFLGHRSRRVRLFGLPGAPCERQRDVTSEEVISY